METNDEVKVDEVIVPEVTNTREEMVDMMGEEEVKKIEDEAIPVEEIITEPETI